MLRKYWPLIILAVPLLIYLPDLQDFAYPFQSPFSDLSITHFSNAVYVKHALMEWGQIPLWSDAIFSGYPFAANPLAGLWYPFGWLVFFVEIPCAFNITILAHILWGGAGMYRFLRSEGFVHYSAIMGAIVFELMPKIFGHFAAGHVTLVYAVCWTPWLLFFQKKQFNIPGIGAGLVFGMILLADVRWALYSGLLWCGYGLFCSPARFDGMDLWNKTKIFGRLALGYLGQVALGVLLAAPLLLPFVEYVSLSTRSLLTGADNLFQSLNPLNLVGLIFPNFGAYAEWLIYPGAFVLLMVVWILLTAELRKKFRFWLLVGFVGLILSLGNYFPLTSWIWSIPGLSFLRVPSRMMFVVGISFAVLAAGGLQWWLSANRIWGWRNKTWFLWLAIPSLISWVVTISLLGAGEAFPIEFAWGSVAVTCASFVLWLRARGKIAPDAFAFSLILFTTVDLLGVGFSQFNFRSTDEVLKEGAQIPSFLALREVEGRIYSTSYDLVPQQQAAILNLELAGGVDPMQLQTYVDYFERASGIGDENYSVVLPPLSSEKYSAANPDTVLLGRLGVKYVVSKQSINLPALEFVQKVESGFVYSNLDMYTGAWVQSGAVEGDRITAAFIDYKSPNQILVEAGGPGVLVLSEIYYPGWHVFVDGQEVELLEVDRLLRGVRLEDGAHRILFLYRPMLLGLGVFLQAVAIICVLIYWRWNQRRTTIFLDTRG